ncbi:MAG: response regulator [Candidatus Thermofonsia Clade 1 bacterium]|uniref:Response regulator n=1 Tax=Candidatus Thermofonsia Clade 1 bacterium TaxID=2364210 RepID=A0A2M8PB16_9CHLR|nr:MAG: response regulator [Candidatus Thermofonsia Clade 1 bacterium]
MSPRTPEPIRGDIRNWTILLVDDTPDNLTVAQAALGYFGVKVHTAENGEEALRLARQLKPTLILLDIKMPKVNGWEVLSAIRQDETLANTVVIAITAYAMDDDRERALAAGFDGYISKPFNLFTFVAEVERIALQCMSH